MRGERVVTAVIFAGLVSLLLVLGGAARHASARLELAEAGVSALSAALIEVSTQLTAARALQQPEPRVVTVTLPCVDRSGHDTPVFPRDSRLYAGH